ncbi:hypothetical protein ASG87_18875 [Frateuria sp. Soil773]|uniref:cytochrome P450 n=1 Tax=Frateuria sp. Soil773 TaxID=1736407 RepID=UPI0006FA7D7B|nr:cytochrome P450 [Frateuria sp. Soil773]KRE90071.1 hypothetical protein ASG87_18875 [Frateuria sp. Soil773]
MSAVPLYNPFLPEFRRDPYPVYAAIRAKEPVHRFAGFRGEQWLLVRYRDVRSLLADARFRVDDLPEQMATKAALAGTNFDRLIACIKHWLFFRDPPDHDVVRRLFSRDLSPGGVEHHRALVLNIVDALLDQALLQGSWDLIRDLAHPLPTLVMAALQGIPAAEMPLVVEWSRRLFGVLVPPQPLDSYRRMDEVVHDFVRFFAPHVAKARAESPRNLLGLLTRAEADGQLDEAGVYAFAIMLFSVGQETTENLIGNGMLGLLRHPDQADMLRNDVGLCADAVDEMLRYDTPVQGVARLSTEPVMIDDIVIPAGARVNFSLGAANRDPVQFQDPDRFLIQRTERSKLPFGAGIHFCLGAHLARLQAECVVQRLFERAPDIRLHASEFEWRESVLLRGIKALPVVTSPIPKRVAAQ